jgi:hypothetical protein
MKASISALRSGPRQSSYQSRKAPYKTKPSSHTHHAPTIMLPPGSPLITGSPEFKHSTRLQHMRRNDAIPHCIHPRHQVSPVAARQVLAGR